MPNPIKIAKAWKTKLIHTEEQKKIADERMAICKACPNRTKDNLLNIEICGLCFCPLAGKVYAEYPECPLQKWVQ